MADHLPSDGWTLKYEFALEDGDVLTVTAETAEDEDAHLVEVAHATTGSLAAPGAYRYREFVEKDGERLTTQHGRISVASVTGESRAERWVRLLRTAIESLITGKVQSVQVNGRSRTLLDLATLEGARTLAPLFEAAQKHASHFFIHRGPASDRVPGQPPLVVPTDTGYARWNLISNSHLAAGGITLGLTDFLDPYPDVSVEIIMLAGFLPQLFDTIIPAARANGVKDPLARLRRLYLDPGPYSVRNAEWVAIAARKLGADRILFGTDYGVGGGQRGDVGPAVETLERVLSEAERRLIFVENSRALLAAKGRA